MFFFIYLAPVTALLDFNLLNKQQWDTRWTFPRKHNIYTTVKISPLPWLHNKSRLSKWKWNGLVFHWCLFMAAWTYEISFSSPLVLKNWFHSFATLTREIFVNTDSSYPRPCNILYFLWIFVERKKSSVILLNMKTLTLVLFNLSDLVFRVLSNLKEWDL